MTACGGAPLAPSTRGFAPPSVSQRASTSICYLFENYCNLLLQFAKGSVSSNCSYIIPHFSRFVNRLELSFEMQNADEVSFNSPSAFSLLTAYQFLRCSDSVSSINLPPSLKAYAKIASSARLAYSLQQS